MISIPSSALWMSGLRQAGAFAAIAVYGYLGIGFIFTERSEGGFKRYLERVIFWPRFRGKKEN